jgi:hypothetical protein
MVSDCYVDDKKLKVNNVNGNEWKWMGMNGNESKWIKMNGLKNVSHYFCLFRLSRTWYLGQQKAVLTKSGDNKVLTSVTIMAWNMVLYNARWDNCYYHSIHFYPQFWLAERPADNLVQIMVWACAVKITQFSLQIMV